MVNSAPSCDSSKSEYQPISLAWLATSSSRAYCAARMVASAFTGADRARHARDGLHRLQGDTLQIESFDARDLPELIMVRGAKFADSEGRVSEIAEIAPPAGIGAVRHLIIAPLAHLRGNRFDHTLAGKVEGRRTEFGETKIGGAGSKRPATCWGDA